MKTNTACFETRNTQTVVEFPRNPVARDSHPSMPEPLARKICRDELGTHDRFFESQVGRHVAYDVVGVTSSDGRDGFVALAFLTDSDGSANSAEAFVCKDFFVRVPNLARKSFRKWSDPFRSHAFIPSGIADKRGRSDLKTVVLAARQFVKQCAVRNNELVQA